MTPTPAMRRAAEELLEELDAGWLHVIKVPFDQRKMLVWLRDSQAQQHKSGTTE